MRPAKVLIIRFSSIGDILLTAPAVAALRDALMAPFEIHFLTKSSMRPVLDGFGQMIDQVHTIDRSTTEVMQTLRDIEFDHIIDLHNNLRSRRVKRALGGIAFTLDKQNLAKWSLVRGWRTRPIPHIVWRYVESFGAAFGAEQPKEWPALFEGARVPDGLPPNFLVAALGAAHAGKQIPATTFSAMFDACSEVPWVLIGGPAERALGAQLAESASGDVRNFAGSTSLAESAAILRHAALTIAGDTGMMHLSAAVGTPVVTLWGCTRPSLGMSAWPPSASAANAMPDKSRPAERPCSKLGDRCRYGEDRCIGTTPIDEVIAVARAAVSAVADDAVSSSAPRRTTP